MKCIVSHKIYLVRDILTEREQGDGAIWHRGFTKQEAISELKTLAPYIKALKKIVEK